MIRLLCLLIFSVSVLTECLAQAIDPNPEQISWRSNGLWFSGPKAENFYKTAKLGQPVSGKEDIDGHIAKVRKGTMSIECKAISSEGTKSLFYSCGIDPAVK